ncbi:MAG: hypothetical protein K0V04_20255 [Deltaproteobacteria bacterium]|nr:hypothetical protein [Deltaproteobacteria bacterium]
MPRSAQPRVTTGLGRSSMRRLAMVAVVGLGGPAVGCEPGSTPRDEHSGDDARVALIQPEAWTPLPADEDPWPGHRPSRVDCPDHAWGPEAGTFEVETGTCNYASFVQPLEHGIEPGDRLSLTVHHLQLWAPEPASAHLALTVGGKKVWEAWPAIPSPEQVIDLEWVSDTRVDATEPVILHLHNHGINSWRLVRFERGDR